MYSPGNFEDFDYTPQRRPHNANAGRNGTSGQSAVPSSVSNTTMTTLSPNAKEFVPQSKQQSNDNSSMNGLTNDFREMTTNQILTSQQHLQQQQQQLFSQHHHQQQQQQSFYFQHQSHQNYNKRNNTGPPERLNKPHHFNNHHQQQQQQQQQQQPPPQYNNLHQQHNLNNTGRSCKTSLQNRLQHNKGQQQQQDHLLTSSSSSATAMTNTSSFFSPSAIQNFEASQEENSQEKHTEEEIFALNYIADIVECLNNDPGSYDSIASRALNVFRNFAENQYVLSNVMEIIFSQSVEEPNFRYMGAKLYALLDSLNPKSDSLFRTLLSCKLNYDRGEIKTYMQSENSKVRGTTLFLAELYMQLRNNGSTVPEIAQHIIFTMNQLLLKQTPENLKCICLTLKLAGYNLEANCPSELNEIIKRLSSIELDVSTNRIIENCLDLHKNNWGRSESVTTQQPLYTNNHNQQPNKWSNEPVFYGPDGKILSEEENLFLDDASADVINEDEPDFDDFEADGMTAEMEQDYNEFLKNTINLTH